MKSSNYFEDIQEPEITMSGLAISFVASLQFVSNKQLPITNNKVNFEVFTVSFFIKLSKREPYAQKLNDTKLLRKPMV